jgi:sporulation protein YlmC with PRC-barrel domain
MRIVPIAAAALALLNVTALAQTHAPGSPGIGTAPAQIQHPPAVNPLTQADVSKIQGTDVYGGDDKSIGHISEVLMNTQTKKIDRFVVAVGGILGVGSRKVALPIEQFSWDGSAGGGVGAFKISQSAGSLTSLPEWHGNERAGG